MDEDGLRIARSQCDIALEALRNGAADAALDSLVAALSLVRRDASAEGWGAIVGEIRKHAIREFIHRDPFALRCFAKPRGYTPDATALDYVLRGRELPLRSSDPVGALHHYTTHGPAARALRFRRDSIAREIDAAARRTKRPARIFSAGSGHLRECDGLTSIRDGRIGKIVAFDMDAENLDGIRRDYPEFPVVTHQGSLRQLVEGRHLFSDMDLVYTAGLLEGMTHATAIGLTRALFAMLAPGGTLLITHFLASLEEAAFLEAFMDWRMVYRTPGELFDLVKELPADMTSRWSYSESPDSSLGLVMIQRK